MRTMAFRAISLALNEAYQSPSSVYPEPGIAREDHRGSSLWEREGDILVEVTPGTPRLRPRLRG